MFIAGAAIQWLRDKLGIIGDAAESGELAESVADSGGVYFVPAFVGLGAPHWDPDARGMISGITAATGRAELARAALEAIGYQTRELVEAMEADSGEELKELRVDGGGGGQRFSDAISGGYFREADCTAGRCGDYGTGRGLFGGFGDWVFSKSRSSGAVLEG